MRILFISNFYPPHALGGMEIRCGETVARLEARGHRCRVLTSRYGSDGASAATDDVVRALHLEADLNYYRPQDFFLQRPGHARANRQALRRQIDIFQPDIIFVWGMWNLSPHVAYWAEQAMPGLVAYAVAGYWPMEPGVHEAYWQLPAQHVLSEVLKAPLRRWVLRKLTKERAAYTLKLEHVACVSEYVRQKLLASGALPHGARVIYNGIDPRPFMAVANPSPPRDGMRLVCVGNLVPHKGVHTAIEALGLLRRQNKLNDLHLTLVGGGHPDYETHLRELVHRRHLSAHVAFYGRVPRKQVADILAAHDVFLFTSVYEEPIARSVMEAMAAGLVVIGTPVGGQQEMLEHGVNALVYAPDDAEALAARIMQLEDDRALSDRLSAAGRQTVLDRFTLQRMVDEMEAWLEEIVV
jgi:glycosyltransferase involved in cell wall biosynthesis